LKTKDARLKKRGKRLQAAENTGFATKIESRNCDSCRSGMRTAGKTSIEDRGEIIRIGS
jgi:hypothetical protein